MYWCPSEGGGGEERWREGGKGERGRDRGGKGGREGGREGGRANERKGLVTIGVTCISNLGSY